MWIPNDEGELRRILDARDIQESHTQEFKSSIGDKPGERAETARDLASFAMDGGVMIVGVAEDKTAHNFEMAPIELAGRMESIEQIARTRIDPPLTIRVKEISSSADPAFGYLVITIPPSPDAPHMVDGVYFGRGERTRQRLSDSEVRRHHSSHGEDGEFAKAALENLIAHDPISSPNYGHLCVVAVPVNPPPRFAEDVAWSAVDVKAIAFGLDEYLPEFLREPNRVVAARYPHRRELGYAWSTLSGQDSDVPIEDLEFEFAIQESGAISLFHGGLTGMYNLRRGNSLDKGLQELRLIAEVWRVLVAAIELGRRTGYKGAWDVGVAARGIGGAASVTIDYRSLSPWNELVTYPSDDYLEVQRVTAFDIETSPSAIVGRLVGRLLRRIGSLDEYREILT